VKAITNRGLLVTGTDTDVGKTYVSCLIARDLLADQVDFRVFKPACSGAVQDESGRWSWPDLDALANAAGIEDPHEISPFRFRAPLAPPVAARAEGCTLDLESMVTAYRAIAKSTEFVVVEGVGGLLCPLSDNDLVADFATQIDLPLLIVARLGLGTINHSLLTVEAARSRGLRVAGIILCDSTNAGNDPSTATNASEIERRTQIPVLGVVGHHANTIARDCEHGTNKIDWINLIDG
jgi:dethiobiotin synthetase